MFDYIAEQGNELPTWYQQKLSRVFDLLEAALAPLAGTRTEIEITQAAHVLWASVHGICMLKIRQRLDLAGNQTTQEMARMLIDHFYKSFST